ncbi:ATP synthase subunit I [Xylophilus sp.]|uniref:ATP synthase subunit I n=1 Tax=Xylophilus sp. TaxID=2653893 RepID=UPI0013BA72EB|nr:ATP synthase subunit I [Xylophilus sp.]KAF1048939.1 MAG: hypothetical protein GAK38_01054 [Xylophilus sp.]
MTIIAPQTDVEAEVADFKPLSAQEAQQWRTRHPVQSPWRVIVLQTFVGALAAVVVGWIAGRSAAGWSAAYGALAVVVPSMLFVRGLARQRGAASAGAAAAGFFMWEMAKIVLAVALLAAAPRLVPGLSWLALLAGMVVTMKTYWIGLLFPSGVLKPSGKDKS